MSKRIKAIILTITMLISVESFSGVAFAAEQVGNLFEKLLVIFNMEPVERDGTEYHPVHVYTGIDSLDYESVGFEMEAVNTDTSEKETKENATTTVYTSMNVTENDGTKKTYTAADLGGKYMFGNELLFNSEKWSNQNTQIFLTPYAVTLDGERITGEKRVLSDAAIKAESPGSALFNEDEEKFDVVFENTDAYLYRVGNANAVALKSLFKPLGSAVIDSGSVSVAVTNESGDAAGTFTANAADWSLGTIQFTGTGVVRVTVQEEESLPCSLDLEVIDAANVTEYAQLKGNANCVLLNDIKMAENASYLLTDAALYGNGFTFDVTDGAWEGQQYSSNSYLVKLTNASMDNIRIVGKVYTQYGGTTTADYNRALVMTSGNSTITNSYLANCASAVRVTDGNLEIVNSTLKGGNFANLDIRNGNIVLDNVTTINQVNANDQAEDGTMVVGLGIVFFYEQVLDTTTLEIRNGLKQYNYISQEEAEQYLTNSYAQALADVIYGADLSGLQYTDEAGTKWANMGILSMIDTVGDENITPDLDGYLSATATLMGTEGYVYTIRPDAESIAEAPAGWEAAAQAEIAPDYEFDYTENYLPKTEGSNRFCYEDQGTVLISFDEGDTFSWNPAILTVAKAGEQLDYKVSMNGQDYTGKEIVFDTTGDYAVEYTYTDPHNYRMSPDGTVEAYDKTYAKTVRIRATAVKASARPAEFTFGPENIPAKTVTIGNKTYIMPDVEAAGGNIGSKTVEGQTVYYPVVEMITSDGKTTHLSTWYGYFPVLKDAVTITDYADGGAGEPVVYDGATTTMPAGLSLVGDPSTVFKYGSGAPAPATWQTQQGMLVFSSPALSGVDRVEQIVDAEYQYTDNMGNIYTYFVRYHCAKQQGCFTDGTRITLADGTQKNVEDVTYEDELLVWDFFRGEYTAAKPSLILNYGTDSYRVMNLQFDDGTVLRLITHHDLFDIAANDYVYIDESTVGSYIGHSFVKTAADGNGNYVNTTARLTGCEITEETVGCYSILTAQHNNCVANGLLTVTAPPQEHWYDYFEIGGNMKYDEAKMQADIEKYGLYDYSVVSDYLTYDQYIAFNVPYLKVLEGKGYIEFEDILRHIEFYGIEKK